MTWWTAEELTSNEFTEARAAIGTDDAVDVVARPVAAAVLTSI